MGWLSQRLNPSCALLRPQRGRACSGFLSPAVVLGLDHLLEPLRDGAVVFARHLLRHRFVAAFGKITDPKLRRGI